MLQTFISPFKKKQKPRQIKKKTIAIRNKGSSLQRIEQKVKDRTYPNECQLRGKIEKTTAMPLIPATVTCDICKLEHKQKALVYNPNHKAFYCFECYYAWKQHQSFLDKLEYSKSADSIFEVNPKKRIISDKYIDEIVVEMDERQSTNEISREQRREQFKRQLSKWQNYVKRM